MNVDVTEKRLFLMDQIQSGQKDVYKTYNERMEYSTAILHSCIITPASLGYCNSMTCSMSWLSAVHPSLVWLGSDLIREIATSRPSSTVHTLMDVFIK